MKANNLVNKKGNEFRVDSNTINSNNEKPLNKKEENGSHSQATAPRQDQIPSRIIPLNQNLFKYLSVEKTILTKLGSHSLAIASDRGSDFLRGSAGSNFFPKGMKFPPPASINKIILLIALIMFSLIFSTTTYAARDFIIENRTSALFVVNGTTGNVLIAPSFGMVGIGTTAPINTLTIVGSFTAFGSLNATFINATTILQNNNQVQTINAVFNLGNYSTEYASTGFKRANITDFFGDAGFNASVLRIGNYSNLFAPAWNFANNESLVLDNATIIRTDNLSLIFLERNNSLWNRTGTSTYLKFIGDNVGIGTITPLSTLHINSSSVDGALRITNGSGSSYTAFFVNASSGNVGIGTTTPQSDTGVSDRVFEVVGNLNPLISTKNTAPGVNQQWAWYGGSSGVWTAFDATNTINVFTLQNKTGNVGIGTNEPSTKLDVVGGIKATKNINLTDGGATNNLNFRWSPATGNELVGITFARDTTSEFAKIISPFYVGGGGLAFFTGNSGSSTERIRIDNSGNVGINNPNPQYLLHINTTTAGATIAKFESDAAGSMQVALDADIDRDAYLVLQEAGTDRWLIEQQGSSGTNELVIKDQSSTKIMTIENAGTANTLYLDSTGNVGIGTTTPNSKLQVNDGRIRTAGDIVGETTGSFTGAGVEIGFDAGTNAWGTIIAYNRSASAWKKLSLDGSTLILNLNSGGKVLINDDTNTKSTIGLTINQGANDDEILALKSSDVAHGMTDNTETDTYGTFVKSVAGDGGLDIFGFSEGGSALQLIGYSVNGGATTKTTASYGYINFATGTKSGTGVADPGADVNLVTIKSGSTTRFIFDAEGSAHADVEWIAFDEYDDIGMLNELDAEMTARKDAAKNKTKHMPKKNKNVDDLQKAKIVNFYNDTNNEGRAMVDTTKLAMLQTGAIREAFKRIDDLQNTKASNILQNAGNISNADVIKTSLLTTREGENLTISSATGSVIIRLG